VHGVDAAGRAVMRRKLQRAEVEPFFRDLPRCTVVLEACGAAHHWARLIRAFGHEVRLLPAEAVQPFVKRGRKNDAADAAALVEAAQRQEIRAVPVNSAERQSVLALHSARSLLVKQQTMLSDAIRGMAAEFGLIVPKGVGKREELMRLVEENRRVPEQAREMIAGLHEQGRITADRIKALERQIVTHARHHIAARRVATIPGTGPITASLIAASVGDNIGAFRRGRDFAAWLGLVPRQHSTSGKTRLGRITKMSNTEIRACSCWVQHR
jgi:error-prone DNA polymerase